MEQAQKQKNGNNGGENETDSVQIPLVDTKQAVTEARAAVQEATVTRGPWQNGCDGKRRRVTDLRTGKSWTETE